MKNNLAKARDDERAFQAHLAKREKEAKDFYLAGAEECLARIEKLRGVNAKKDLAEWFDRCRLWLLLTKNDRQVKSLANENRKKISTATRTLLKAIHETGLDALAELLGGDDAADDFVATLHLARKRLTAPRRRGPKRDEGRDAFGMALMAQPA